MRTNKQAAIRGAGVYDLIIAYSFRLTRSAFLSTLSNVKKAVVYVMLLGCFTAANAAITNYFNFETAPVQPIALGPDGYKLAVCNLPDNRVEFFDVSNGIPGSVGSVAVGLDPVTARFESTNDLWVVNHISSTISIVDVAAKRVVATVETPAGPSDLIFARQWHNHPGHENDSQGCRAHARAG